MKAEVFQRILNELNCGSRSELNVTVAGNSYTRAFLPDDRLILLGGGHVSHALCSIAVMLDFSVVVVDDRPAFANTARFPTASQVICDSFVKAIDDLHISSSDYVCVLTRGHRWDKDCVETILGGEVMPYYLGMIGSRRRVEGLTNTLIDEGFDRERISQLHAPIGLRIGGITPAEIALSICAEMVMRRREKPMSFGGDVLDQMNTDYEMLRYLADSSEPRAMLMVLSSDGSTPVKSGSIMAVNALGQGCGTIGGGCSEAAAIAKARRIIGTGESRVIEIDMSNEVAADNGMVCGGSMTVLIEDITHSEE